MSSDFWIQLNYKKRMFNKTNELMTFVIDKF